MTIPALKAAVLALVLAATAGQAQATMPAGNLLLNADGETGQAATDETEHFCPPSWSCEPNGTLVRYGVTSFPSLAESARIGGGTAFFAGGPGDQNSGDTGFSQQVDLSGAAAEIDAGQVQATFGGCLGGWGTLEDSASIQGFYQGKPAANVNISGPTAAQRENQTKFLPRAKTLHVPEGARLLVFVVEANLNHPAAPGVYNNGYADNLSLQLSHDPGPAPATASCAPPGGAGAGGGDKPSGPAPGAQGSGPHQKLRFKRTQDIDNLALFVRTDVAVKLTVNAGVSVPAGLARTLAFKRIRKSVKANTRTKIRLRLSRKRKAVLKRALRHTRRLKARVKLTAVDGAGNRQVRRVKIAVKN